MNTHFYNQNWYVAQIKAPCFERAAANLTRQGFLTFSPMQKKTVRHARKLKNVLRPVFPGYLFVRFGADNSDWRKINSILVLHAWSALKISAGSDPRHIDCRFAQVR